MMSSSESVGALVKSGPGTQQRRRPGAGAKKLAPLEDTGGNGAGQPVKPKKIFSKKDLAESVRKMTPARYAAVSIPKSTSAVISRAGDSEAVTQLKVMDEGVNLNARRFNDLKLEADRKAKELKQRLDVLQCLKMENDALLEMKKKQTPESLRIEELMVQIESANKVTEEKLHYRRQLQHMLRRLNKNQITFDAHINAMEDALCSAQREHEDVKSLCRQLEAGKTKAILDLYEIQRQVSIERRDRTRVISMRQHEATNARKMEDWRKEREVMRAEFSSELKGDLSADEEMALKQKLQEREALAEELRTANEAKLKELNKLEEQFTAIRQATGVNSLEEMVEKFIGQEGNREALNNERKEVENRLADAKRRKEEAEARFSELKASGIGSTELNREISEELNGQIQHGRMELKVTRAACERLENILVSLRQGATGLFQRLESYLYLVANEGTAALDVSTMEPVETVALSEQILSRMMEAVGGDASPSRFGQSMHGEEDGGEGMEEGAAEDETSAWSALGVDDLPQAMDNVRVKTLRESRDPQDEGSAAQPSQDEGSAAETGREGQEFDIVPTRDFLKLSSSRQHAEMMRKKESDVKRQKMLERFEAAEEADKEKLAALSNKKKRQRDAINKLSENKEIVGVPPGVNPKMDPMSRSQCFLDHAPELL